ncbi:MAG TPA: hypothetical protein VGD40_21170 [Chryseosolibacter sp.]
MKKDPQFELRSDEIQEIITHVPSGLIRYGTIVVFIVLATILLISWFIKYPDLLEADVVVTTTPSPIDLVARVPGKLVILKGDNENCQRGELVGYIQSHADVFSVLELERTLAVDSSAKNLPDGLQIGELQPFLSSLKNAQTELRLFHQNDMLASQILRLKNQLDTYGKLSSSFARQVELSKEDLSLGHQKFLADSTLFKQQVTSSLDFNRAKSEWVQQQRAARNFETTLLSNELQMKQVEKQISDLVIQRQETGERLKLAGANAYRELTNQIKKWKDSYLLYATRDGLIAHLGFLENDMYVEISKPLFSILPADGNIIARATLPIAGSGKVKIGQRVNIRLASYPFQQYGMLSGVVKSISQVPTNNSYVILISLPDKLVTSQKIDIDFRQQLSGTTQIVTEDMRLISRFIYRFRLLLPDRSS